MKWTDSQRIAEELFDKYPDIDPRTIRFTDLMAWVMALDGFNDAPEHCGEKILEAIQLAWLDEAKWKFRRKLRHNKIVRSPISAIC